MEQAIKAFTDEVKAEGRKAIRSLMKDIANNVETDFMSRARTCMDNYYAEYEPSVYKRTQNLAQHGFHPYRRYRKNEVDVGVAFSPDEMKPYGRKLVDADGEPITLDIDDMTIRTVEELVVSNFMHGFHGDVSIRGDYVDQSMQEFTETYAVWMDKYMDDNFEKYFK